MFIHTTQYTSTVHEQDIPTPSIHKLSVKPRTAPLSFLQECDSDGRAMQVERALRRNNPLQPIMKIPKTEQRREQKGRNLSIVNYKYIQISKPLTPSHIWHIPPHSPQPKRHQRKRRTLLLHSYLCQPPSSWSYFTPSDTESSFTQKHNL